MTERSINGLHAWQAETEEYIGDGLYASFDGYSFWLRAPRTHGDHYVCLEPAVMQSFDTYRKDIFDKIIDKKGT